ncbi:MAG TPA: HEAT repeat domain-containing protein [Planctomycetota bacterium]|nr:HEAT repeat domain-containing protein [Planctomycetota bacterium]HRR82067.1 HEAT repeat domain-containing protein [Planctomycetota bacterium]
MPVSEELKKLVDQMPDADRRGMYSNVYEEKKPKPKEGEKEAPPPEQPKTYKDVDKERIEAAIAEIHKGGRESLLGLIDLLVEPVTKNEEAKPHYALHALALHVCKLEDKAARKEFANTLAAQLGGNRPKPVQAYLCQEIGTAGGKDAAPALGKLLTDDELCDPAARALTAIREGAAEQFRAALPKAAGKCKLTIVQNLGVLADAESVAALKAAAADADAHTRMAAVWALANIGDAGSLDVVLKASDAKPGWERIQNTKSCLLLAERLIAAGKKAEAARLYTHLRDTRTDASEKYVREAAEQGLAAAR